MRPLMGPVGLHNIGQTCCLNSLIQVLVRNHDAAQLYLTVWNLIKDQITDVDLVARLQALYTIRVKESLACLECASEVGRNSSMLALPLSVFDMDSKPLKTLEDALHCFFQPQELSSADKCFCGSCGRKTRWNAEEQCGGYYELFAVIAHVGNADYGHYCAYIRSSADGEWFYFNDSNCTYGNRSYRWGETAYLLFYIKTES
ncbi:hypothetical protein FD754_018504 [Muntiacus muntjak]|uniref:USP domain-containing protein n=1 Tax=Muntiacus muntjak TaxID=9888 RepID=A0A5N3UXR3_MUNMU|nr:hypothetical protein FD754_018504 [Muntiacus muntjak]